MIDNQRPALAAAPHREQHTPRSHRWVCSTLASCVVVVGLTACGKADETSGQQADDKVASAQDTYKSVLKASGLAKETADGKLVVDIEKDGERVQVGKNLPIPEWLPKGFPLPADLSIQLIAVDLNRESKLEGRSTAVTKSDLAQRVADWSTANSWEVVGANSSSITTVSAAGDVVDVRIKDGESVELTMSKRSVAFDRQKSAIEIISPGIATVTLASKTHTLKGECKIKGTSYGFEFYAPDGSTTGIVNIQSSDSDPVGSAMFQIMTGGGLNQYSINFPMSDGEGPKVRVSGKEFSVSGNFGSIGSAGMKAVPGIYSVKCE